MGFFSNSLIKILVGKKNTLCCTALVEDEDNPGTISLCENEPYGHGENNEVEFYYCKAHIPSEALVAGGRIRPIEFYIPDNERIIEVE